MDDDYTTWCVVAKDIGFHNSWPYKNIDLHAQQTDRINGGLT